MTNQEPICEIVGSSEMWYHWENANGFCHECSGDGELALTSRAAYKPSEYRSEVTRCYICGGTGFQRREMRSWIE
jgi:hypothetical protein